MFFFLPLSVRLFVFDDQVIERREIERGEKTYHLSQVELMSVDRQRKKNKKRKKEEAD